MRCLLVDMKKTFIFNLFVIFPIFSCAQSLFELTLQEALSGDSKAQNNIAAYYKEGYGVTQDCSKAIYWYRMSARQNDPVGIYGLGQCYAMGCGVEQDWTIAAKYILVAARSGVKEAQQAIAYMYHYGLGVKQDSQTATYWYQKSNSNF